MDRLSQELITHIAFFVDREDDQSDEKTVSQLPAYATLSRKWQLAVESRTFRSLRLKSTELPYFTRVLTDHRRDLLANLAYDAVLPTYTDIECAKFETKEDMERNSQAFTYAVHALFQILKSWEAGNTRTKSRLLSLDLSDIYSPMDRFHRDSAKYEEHRELYESNKRSDLWEHRYEHSILQLLEHPELPTLSCVSSFRLSFIAHRHVEPRSATLLAMKFLNLQSITIELHDNEKKHSHIRQQLRHDFAVALPTLFNPSLRNFTLNYYNEDPSNQYFSPPSTLLPSAPSTDHLSLTLHTLSQSPNLTSIRLNPIVISPDLYWPTRSPSTPPTWPSLRQCHVEFNMTTPTGSWYFVRDPSKPIEDDEGANDSDDNDDDPQSDSDSSTSSTSSFHPGPFREKAEKRLTGDYPIRTFRTLPSDTHINPLLLAMARAAAHMPQLQSMSLTSTIRDPDAAGFEVYFYQVGQAGRFDTDAGDVMKARLNWYMGSWRPEEEVLRVWREGKEGVVVRFVEW